jgi:hypothetical protein
MHDPFGRTRLPGNFTREGRVQLLGELMEDLLALRNPSPEAALFLGAALSSWLVNGGVLDRDHLKVVKAKSHRTPAAIWRAHRASVIRMSDDENEPRENDGTQPPETASP